MIVASSFMLLYLAEGYGAWRRIVRGEALAQQLREGGAEAILEALACQ